MGRRLRGRPRGRRRGPGAARDHGAAVPHGARLDRRPAARPHARGGRRDGPTGARARRPRHRAAADPRRPRPAPGSDDARHARRDRPRQRPGAARRPGARTRHAAAGRPHRGRRRARRALAPAVHVPRRRPRARRLRAAPRLPVGAHPRGVLAARRPAERGVAEQCRRDRDRPRAVPASRADRGRAAARRDGDRARRGAGHRHANPHPFRRRARRVRNARGAGGRHGTATAGARRRNRRRADPGRALAPGRGVAVVACSAHRPVRRARSNGNRGDPCRGRSRVPARPGAAAPRHGGRPAGCSRAGHRHTRLRDAGVGHDPAPAARRRARRRGGARRPSPWRRRPRLPLSSCSRPATAGASPSR